MVEQIIDLRPEGEGAGAAALQGLQLSAIRKLATEAPKTICSIAAWPRDRLAQRLGEPCLLSAGDTSYPLLNATPSARELDEAFTPNLFELAFAEKHANRPQSLMGLLLLLKTFQRVGYFVRVADIPLSIVRRVTHAAGLQEIPEGLTDDYDSSRTRGQHLALVRSYIVTLPISVEFASRRVIFPISVEKVAFVSSSERSVCPRGR